MRTERRDQVQKKIAIVGLPNTGKSLVYNYLTRDYSIVANYPHTTLTVRSSICNLHVGSCKVLDTPGMHNLFIHTEEELSVRDMVFKEKPDLIIQCINANQLSQSLTLTADLLELQIPLVISLNSIRETAWNGFFIDSEELCHQLGVPVIETTLGDKRSVKELINSLQYARKGNLSIRYGDMIEAGIADLESIMNGKVPYPRKFALLILQKDPRIKDCIQDFVDKETMIKLEGTVQQIHQQFSGNLAWSLINKRNRWQEKITNRVTKKIAMAQGTIMQRLEHWSRHPVFGFFILAWIILLTYFSVVYVAGLLESILNQSLVTPITQMISQRLPFGFWHDLVVGHYGILTLGVFNALCTILPILLMFFLLLSLLEDIGYLSSLCVLTTRFFDKIGIGAGAILSLVLAFGCKTMATLSTKSLRSFKAKYITNFLVAFTIPCASQLAIYLGVLGRFGLKTFGITAGILLGTTIITGIILNKIIKENLQIDFIQELPAFRVPQFKTLIEKTYYRIKWFLEEALPIFVLASLLLFFSEKIGILKATKDFFQPIVMNWLGLPRDIVDVLILGIARREVAAGVLLKLVDSGGLTYIQCIVAIILSTTLIPCSAHIVSICKEFGMRRGIYMVLSISTSALLLSGILHWVFRFILGES